MKKRGTIKADSDRIILDMMLPYFSGFELLKQIKHIPVIFLTVKDRPEDKLERPISGAKVYVSFLMISETIM